MMKSFACGSSSLRARGSGTRSATTVQRLYVRSQAGNGSVYGRQQVNSAAEPTLLDLMKHVANGQLSAELAAQQLSHIASGATLTNRTDLAEAPRVQRKEFPEVVWGPGKTPQQIASVLVKFAEEQHVAVATRVEPQVFAEIQDILPDATYNQAARCVLLKNKRNGFRKQRLPGAVAILSACSSDPAVVEECRMVAEAMGCYCFKRTDVEVHRLEHLLASAEALQVADVVIVVIGVDGALPSVVAGLVDAPVIAVPSSQTYGGLPTGSPITAMPSYGPGVAVVNTDSGFAAAMFAARILSRTARTLQKITPAAVGVAA